MFRTKSVRIVYRCKSTEEALRRVARAEALKGTPFVHLPGNPDQKSVLFVSRQNHAVTVEMMEVVYNDMLLMDAISDQGKDGPLTINTFGDDPQSRTMREILKAGINLYQGRPIEQ
jgi:hypothetical protein